MEKDICFFYETYGNSGGVKTYIDEINNYFIKKGYKTDIISLIKSNNKDCISLFKKRNIKISFTIFYFIKLIFYFYKNDYKIIHCQSLYSLILINFLKKIFFKKFIIFSTIHIPYQKSFLTKILKILKIDIKSEYLIGCCEYSLKETNKLNLVNFNNNISILNWSLNINDTNNNFIKDNNVIFIGHLSYQKNIDLLSDVIKSLPQYNFKIIGSGNEKYKLKNIKNVKFMGVLSHKNTIKELKKSKILILTSKFEALPYVVLEAISLGIPVVSSNVGGINELTKFTNQLFLCESQKDFIKFINKIYKDKTNKMINLIDQINFNNQIKKYETIYKKYL